MSKRGRDEEMAGVEEHSLGPRPAKRKAIEIIGQEKVKSDTAAEKRAVNKKLRGEVDDLAGLFGTMKASEQDGQGRRRRRRTRKHKKSKKSKKTRKH
jgi:hypothetical protein